MITYDKDTSLMNTLFYSEINHYITNLTIHDITKSRIKELQSLIDYIQEKKHKNLPIHLNFICTHNSRRSQFAQVWAHLAAIYYTIENFYSHSSGTSVTACNPRMIQTLNAIGFKISPHLKETQIYYTLNFSQQLSQIILYSKLNTQAIDQDLPFAALMICTNADQNCPLLSNAEKRISLPHHDPKAYDHTPLETKKYAETSRQIATELFYVMSQIH
jgi:arsenate reductase (thioredoxin)